MECADAHRAVEALWVVVVVEGLHPPVTRLDGEPAGDTLGREQLIPIWNYESIILGIYLKIKIPEAACQMSVSQSTNTWHPFYAFWA